MPAITELTRIEPIHLQRLERQGIFTTGLLLEVSETVTRRQTLADQVDASTNDVLRWRDEALLLNLAGFGPAEHDLFRFAGIDGLHALLGVELERVPRRHRRGRHAAPGRAAVRTSWSRPGGSRPGRSRKRDRGAARRRRRPARARARCGGGRDGARHRRRHDRALLQPALGRHSPRDVRMPRPGRAGQPAQVDAVTRDIVVEVWVGPGTFAQEVAGEAVFTERERSHMADVRQPRARLLRARRGRRDRPRRPRPGLRAGPAPYWRAVALGAKVLAVGTIAVGVAFALFFDRAFTLFHQLFFAEGTWTFDPATDRLVQLFPYAFWTETTIAIAVVGPWSHRRRLARRVAPRAPLPTPPVPAGGSPVEATTADDLDRLRARRLVRRSVGPVLVAAGFVLTLGGNAIGGLALVLAGWTARAAVQAADRRDRLQQLLDGVTVGDVMETGGPGGRPARHPRRLRAGARRRRRRRRRAGRRRRHASSGSSGPREVARVPRARWSAVRAGEAMTATASLPGLVPGEPLGPAAERLGASGATGWPVVADGRPGRDPDPDRGGAGAPGPAAGVARRPRPRRASGSFAGVPESGDELPAAADDEQETETPVDGSRPDGP